MTFGAVETPSMERPPDGPVAWMVWPKGAPDEHGRIVVFAQLWFEARTEGCRRLGVVEVDGRRATDEEAALARGAAP